MDRKASFPPLVDRHTRLLLLGSLPGEASLRAARYYAHPQNQFWRLVGAVIDRNLAGLPYDDRLEALLEARIGLWDVVADAVRPGSLDTAIRDHRPNDLIALIATLPDLRAIGFNGKTAARIGRKLLPPGDRVVPIDLPSSSPAHTIGFDKKRTAWVKLKKWLTATRLQHL
jgi:TDG/mug DNA glycosylase family protein